jgi:hypothetical protein
MKEKCSKWVYSGHRYDFRGHQCANAAKKDGFCGIHHPDAVKKREEISSEKWRAKQSSSLITKLSQRIDYLESAIATAPHSIVCDFWRGVPCNCWKSKV